MSKRIDDLPFDQVHGPLYPTERRHEFPRDPPKRSACHRNHDKLSKWQDAVLVWRGGKYARHQLRITLRWQPVTPSAQSQPWPREGNVKYPTRETLTCRHRRCTTAKNFYIVTLCKVASAFIPFSLPNLKCCTFCVFLILLNKYRVESKAKDDFKFPVMVEDGKHSCTEVNSLNINSLFSSL